MDSFFLTKFAKKSYSEVVFEWLSYKKSRIKDSTYNKYCVLVEKYIGPYFSNHNIRLLTQHDIFLFFGADEIKNLSNSTKNNILVVINSSLMYAAKNGYRKDDIKINLSFKRLRNDITYFTRKEQYILEMYLIKNMNRRNLLILVALYTGARIGEICALKGSDIDNINYTISINKTVQRMKDGNKTSLILQEPKTESSRRTIPVPKFIIKLVEDYSYNNDYFLFTNSDKPKEPRAVEKYFADLLGKLEIRNLKFHSLRHTFATRLREQKVDIKVISELLGHSSWKITQDIYVHASLDCKKDSIDELEDMWLTKTYLELV